MPRQYEVHEEFRTSRSRQRAPSPPSEREFTPEYYPGGAPVTVADIDPPPAASGALPPPYPPSAAGALQLPPSRSRSRPRSVPAMTTDIISTTRERAVRRRRRSPYSSRSPSPDWHGRDRERDRAREGAPRTPIEKAGEVLKDKFSHSTTGLGVGLLGAAVGAWVAHEASDAQRRYKNGKEYEENNKKPKYRPQSPQDSNNSKSKIALTVLGAVVGGLGASAIERRVEEARERDRNRRDSWERKWSGRDDDGYYTSGDERSRSRTRQVEVRTRGRRIRHGDESEWEEEDYVYEKRQPSTRRSASTYRNRD